MTDEEFNARMGCAAGLFMSVVWAVIAAVAFHFIKKWW